VRRFIATLPGRLLGQLLILALLLPTITLALSSRASAQVAVLPSWAVVEFRNLKSPGTEFGRNAAAAVAGELAKTGQYDVTPQESVQRAIETLGIASPPDVAVNLFRVAQEIRASTVVAGDIVDYRILNVGAGRQAVVQMQVSVYDVASGIRVNGAVVRGQSTIRPGDVTEEALVNDAIAKAPARRFVRSRGDSSRLERFSTPRRTRL